MRKDLTGMRFGRLVVIGIDEDRTKDGKVYWLCRCDCLRGFCRECDPEAL